MAAPTDHGACPSTSPVHFVRRRPGLFGASGGPKDRRQLHRSALNINSINKIKEETALKMEQTWK